MSKEFKFPDIPRPEGSGSRSQSDLGIGEGEKIQDEIFRKMGPEKRLRLAGEFYNFAKKMIAAESGEKIYERIRRASNKNSKGS